MCEHEEKSYQIELLTEFSSGVYAVVKGTDKVSFY